MRSEGHNLDHAMTVLAQEAGDKRGELVAALSEALAVRIVLYRCRKFDRICGKT